MIGAGNSRLLLPVLLLVLLLPRVMPLVSIREMVGVAVVDVTIDDVTMDDVTRETHGPQKVLCPESKSLNKVR